MWYQISSQRVKIGPIYLVSASSPHPLARLQMEALAESNLLLARANEALVSRLEDHDDLKLSNVALAHELALVRADKITLEQEVHLGAIQRSTRRKKFYISSVPFVVGLFSFATCSTVLFYTILGHIDSVIFIWFLGMGFAASIMLLVVKPTDGWLIRFFTAMLIASTPYIVITFLVVFVITFPPTGICPIGNNHTAQQIAGAHHACWEASILMLGLCCAYIVAFIIVLTTLRRHETVARSNPIWRSLPRFLLHWIRTHSSMAIFLASVSSLLLIPVGISPYIWVGLWAMDEHEKGHFVMPVRLALRRMWMGTRLGVTISTTLSLVALLVLLALDEPTQAGAPSNAPARNSVYVGLFVFALMMFLFAIQTPEVRAWIHGWLNRWAMSGEAGRAAGIAAMIGKLDAQAVLTLSRRNFRGIPYSAMTRTHLDPTSHAQTLRGLAKRIPLGTCDAFISHSWSDPADDKWSALCEWAEAFSRAHKNEPTFWFDRACIDQQNITEQLACLPVWLSGCRTLLVLAGRTYTHRLWYTPSSNSNASSLRACSGGRMVRSDCFCSGA